MLATRTKRLNTQNMQTRKRSLVVSVGWVTAAVIMLYATNEKANALPQFARKLGVGCATCHTSPPRLNETGYKFRAAGFRMPEEIGKGDSKPFKFTDYNGIRLQARYDATKARTGADAPHNNNFNLFAAEFYIMMGSWGKNLSSNFKVTYYPEESYDTEEHVRVEGNLKYTVGNEKRFFEVRAGVPHPMEGFGASDTLIADTRPYFQEHPADFEQSTFFTPWNFHQAGVTFGYYQGRTSIRALVLEGIRLHGDEHDLKPIGKKEPFTDTSPFFKHHGADFQLLINRILNHNAGAVSLYYYRGNLDLPVANTTRAFRNDFNRLAFYASYPVAKRMTLLGGVQRGRDDMATGGRFTSLGAYAEAAVPVINELTNAGVRYDWFDPARNKKENEAQGLTVYLNTWVKNQFRFVTEYQRRNIKRGLLPEKNDNAFQLRLIFIK